MKQIHTKSSIVFVVIIASLTLVATIPLFSSAKDNQDHTNRVEEKSSSVETPEAPMIIWWGGLWGDYETLQSAVSSRIFSHVMLAGLHEFDRPDYFTHDNFKKALKLCKEKKVKIIWTRCLYPGYHLSNFRLEDVFDSQYYIQRIREIREEAKQMGVDLVAFDAEPYANCPVKALKKDKLSEDEFRQITDAIDTAIGIVGQVNFVMPAKSPLPRYLYNATSSLGKFVIAEHTYYDIPAKIKDVRRPYDIFGAYVKIVKENKKNPKQPYFTPQEILQRQELWSHKKGLFIYPGSRENAAAVALEFSKIRFVQPVQDSNSIR